MQNYQSTYAYIMPVLASNLTILANFMPMLAYKLAYVLGYILGLVLAILAWILKILAHGMPILAYIS